MIYDITLSGSCDALGGAVVECELKFEMTSESLWVTSSQIQSSQVKKPLENSIWRRPNSRFKRPNLRWYHSEAFWRHIKFRFTFNYCTPKCNTGYRKGNRFIYYKTKCKTKKFYFFGFEPKKMHCKFTYPTNAF